MLVENCNFVAPCLRLTLTNINSQSQRFGADECEKHQLC